MKANQMLIAAANELHIPANKTQNNMPYDGFQIQVVRPTGFNDNLKAESISVTSDVYAQFSGAGVYDVMLAYGSRKPIIVSIKKVSGIVF